MAILKCHYSWRPCFPTAPSLSRDFQNSAKTFIRENGDSRTLRNPPKTRTRRCRGCLLRIRPAVFSANRTRPIHGRSRWNLQSSGATPRQPTQPITVKADTATSKLRNPGATPGGLTRETGRVEQSAQEQHNNTGVSLGESHKGEDGIHKWVWFAISKIVAVLLPLVVISGNGGNDSSTAGSDDSPEELKIPSAREMIKTLGLPDSVTALIQRRDKNKDGHLTSTNSLMPQPRSS